MDNKDTVTGQHVIQDLSGRKSARVLRVCSGTSSSPISKFLYRLNAPRRWWSRSTVRIMVLEACSLPSRIRAIPKAAGDFQEGLPLQSYPVPVCMESLYEENMLPHFYMLALDTEKQRTQRRFFGVLDQQTFALGFREGVESVLRIADMKMTRKGQRS
jgi:hypothetical protein